MISYTFTDNMSQPKIRAAALYTVRDSVASNDNDRVLLDEFRSFTQGQPSPVPSSFRSNSLSGYEAYQSTDFPVDDVSKTPAYCSGFTVMGLSGQFGVQLATNWNAEEERPVGMYVRVNDDTADLSTWGQWNAIHLGNTTFTTSTAAPTTPGRRGDIMYNITIPRMWTHTGIDWVAVQQIQTNDRGTWRSIKEKWQNYRGSWFKVFGSAPATTYPVVLNPAYTTAMGPTWYSDAPNGSTADQYVGDHRYTVPVQVAVDTNISAYLYGSVDNSISAFYVNGVATAVNAPFDLLSVYASSNFTLTPGMNVVQISIMNTEGPEAFALQIRNAADHSILCDIDKWFIG